MYVNFCVNHVQVAAVHHSFSFLLQHIYVVSNCFLKLYSCFHYIILIPANVWNVDVYKC